MTYKRALFGELRRDQKRYQAEVRRFQEASDSIDRIIALLGGLPDGDAQPEAELQVRSPLASSSETVPPPAQDEDEGTSDAETIPDAVERILREEGRPLKVIEIATRLGRDRGPVGTAVHRYAKNGRFQMVGRGLVALPEVASAGGADAEADVKTPVPHRGIDLEKLRERRRQIEEDRKKRGLDTASEPDEAWPETMS